VRRYKGTCTAVMNQNAPIYPPGVCDLKELGDQSRYPPRSMGGGSASVIICILDGEKFGRDQPHGKIVPAYYVLQHRIVLEDLW
jgi:hypothetical protein